MMTLDIAVVSESAVYQGRGNAVGAQRCSEYLRLKRSSRLLHKPPQHGANIVTGCCSGKQRSNSVQDDCFRAFDDRGRNLLIRKGLHEIRETIRHAGIAA